VSPVVKSEGWYGIVLLMGKCNLGPGPRGKFLVLIVELSGINRKKFWN
jgi:hypothetical protein